jgi:hypothetical protein
MGPIAPCSGNGTIIYIESDPTDYIWKGQTKTWGSVYLVEEPFYPFEPPKSLITVHYSGTMIFSTRRLGHPIEVGAYTSATNEYAMDAGHPGLFISSPGSACNMICGRFEVYKIAHTSTGTLSEFLVSFVQNCECGKSSLRGCFHYLL